MHRPSHPSRPPAAAWRYYALALVALAGSLLLRLALNPVLGHQGPYILMTLAVVIAALYGGFGPAIFATVVGCVVGTFLFVATPGEAAFLQKANVGRMVLFLVIGFSISVIGGRLSRTQQALRETVAKLRAGHLEKDNVLVTLAHEIRNPLASLHSAAEVLKRHPGDIAPRMGEIVGKQVVHMNRMAEDLLDVASGGRGELHLSMTAVNLVDLLTEAADQVAALIERKQHRLVMDFDTDFLPAQGDGTRLVQVFANLIGNAAKYTLEPGTITLSAVTREGWAVVDVADTGIGLDPVEIDALFEPFVRAESARQSAEGGLGLGLAIVSQIVALHGGDVSAISAGVGRGSLFRVRLPLGGGIDTRQVGGATGVPKLPHGRALA